MFLLDKIKKMYWYIVDKVIDLKYEKLLVEYEEFERKLEELQKYINEINEEVNDKK